MAYRPLFPSVSGGGTARPEGLWFGWLGGVGLGKNQPKTTGGWGGHPHPSSQGNGLCPHLTTLPSGVLASLGLIYRQAGTFPHPIVTLGYIFKLRGERYARFIEGLVTKVPCLIRTKRGYYYPLDKPILKEKGGDENERNTDSHSQTVVFQVQCLDLAHTRKHAQVGLP